MARRGVLHARLCIELAALDRDLGFPPSVISFVAFVAVGFA